jgi:alanine dehydrogenase
VTAGARIVPTAADAWAAQMVIKVKEPVATEYGFLRKDLLLFTYLHLAADKKLTEELVKSKTTGIAYETVQIGRRLPLLEPMSEIAGRMSAIVGAFYLSKAQGGEGVLLGGVPGVLPGNVLIIGGGTSGINAGRVAAGMGAEVTILEVDLQQMRYLDISLHGSAHTLYSNEQNLIGYAAQGGSADRRGAGAGRQGAQADQPPMLKAMKKGSVFVDIAIDQGGCAETSRPTTHENPIYVEEDTVHYCVANMPGAYARTATMALTNATIPYAVKLANLGFEPALQQVPELVPGLNTHAGFVTYKAVADATGLPYQEWKA